MSIRDRDDAVRVRPTTTAALGTECRCLCGNLLARLVPDGVELKCRRCKRVLVIPLQGDDSHGSQRSEPHAAGDEGGSPSAG